MCCRKIQMRIVKNMSCEPRVRRCIVTMEVDTDVPLSIGNLKPKYDRPVIALGIEGSANKVSLLSTSRGESN